jgi:hypothetical protein
VRGDAHLLVVAQHARLAGGELAQTGDRLLCLAFGVEADARVGGDDSADGRGIGPGAAGQCYRARPGEQRHRQRSELVDEDLAVAATGDVIDAVGAVARQPLRRLGGGQAAVVAVQRSPYRSQRQRVPHGRSLARPARPFLWRRLLRHRSGAQRDCRRRRRRRAQRRGRRRPPRSPDSVAAKRFDTALQRRDHVGVAGPGDPHHTRAAAGADTRSRQAEADPFGLDPAGQRRGTKKAAYAHPHRARLSRDHLQGLAPL